MRQYVYTGRDTRMEQWHCHLVTQSRVDRDLSFARPAEFSCEKWKRKCNWLVCHGNQQNHETFFRGNFRFIQNTVQNKCTLFGYLPRWMECRRGLAMKIVSVRLSDKRVHYYKKRKNMSRFLYHTKEYLA